MADVKGSTTLPDKAFLTSTALAQVLPAEAVLDALKLIGASLNEVLESVARLIEAHRKDMMCSISRARRSPSSAMIVQPTT